MTAELTLAKPSIELKDAYIEFYEEWKSDGGPMVPWVISKDPYDFPGMVQFLLDGQFEERIPAHFVPHTTYWLLNEGRVVGVTNIRHRLNEKLLNNGGHIGYGIRPSERRQGYASALLAMALEKAHGIGIRRVLVVCDKSNIGSERTIVKNGGVFESEYVEDDGNTVRRFWIG